MQAMADGAGSRTKMGTWAMDEREAELCELIADQDAKWDESMAGKEQWINIPAQPPGLFRSGMPMPAAKPSKRIITTNRKAKQLSLQELQSPLVQAA